MIIHKIERDNIGDISEKDKKLYSLIASQISPPILSAKLLGNGLSKAFDLYSPLVAKLEEEISLADDFGIPLNLIILKLQGASSSESEQDGITILTDIVSSKLSQSQSIYRYGRSKLLVIMPNLTQDEAFSFISLINKEARAGELSLNLEFSTVVFPDDGANASELLFKAE
jgi:hypothetical protein